LYFFSHPYKYHHPRQYNPEILPSIDGKGISPTWHKILVLVIFEEDVYDACIILHFWNISKCHPSR
jgi:hypothetical protein